MDLHQTIENSLDEHLETIIQVRQTLLPELAQVAEVVSDALHIGAKVLLMGNGGSAADAQHIAAELVGRFESERQALAAIALTTDTSILTAISNDYGYDQVFARQVAALAQPGDVVIGISTSGNSENVFQGLQTATDKGCITVAFLGQDGGRIKDIVEYALVIPSTRTARIQEAHLLLGHILCELVESQLSVQHLAMTF